MFSKFLGVAALLASLTPFVAHAFVLDDQAQTASAGNSAYCSEQVSNPKVMGRDAVQYRVTGYACTAQHMNGRDMKEVAEERSNHGGFDGERRGSGESFGASFSSATAAH